VVRVKLRKLPCWKLSSSSGCEKCRALEINRF
jgi:hypothetical protein